MPEIKCFCHCHIGKWISSLDCQCFHGMHQTKCSHCESPKPAQLDRRYVGIEDKNRKPIRENDLVEITYYRVGGGALPEKYKGEVIFKSGGFWAGDISFVEIMNNNALAIKGQKLPMDIEIVGVLGKPAQLAGIDTADNYMKVLVEDLKTLPDGLTVRIFYKNEEGEIVEWKPKPAQLEEGKRECYLKDKCLGKKCGYCDGMPWYHPHFDDADDNQSPLTQEDREPRQNWEYEFKKRFSDMVTSAIWYTPVKEFIINLLAAKDREADERVRQLEKKIKLTKEDEELIEKLEEPEPQSGLKPWYLPISTFKAVLKSKNLEIAEAVRLERERYHAIVDDAFGWVVTSIMTKNPYDTYLFDNQCIC